MLSVSVDSGNSVKLIFTTEQKSSAKQLWDIVEQKTGLCRSNFYLKNNSRLVSDDDVLQYGAVTINPRLFGGKGGFGSMLRAIGAQIEKTTNREACRDLSGRRLRDINEEKRLKAWIEKQSDRTEEAAERKKKKLDKLCAVPKHHFKNEKYDEERSKLAEKISDAVEEGFKALGSSSGVKRKSESKPTLKKKRKTMLDDDSDIDLDEISDSDSSDDGSAASKKSQSPKPDNCSNSSNSSSEDSKNAEESICREQKITASVQDVNEDSGRSTDCSEIDNAGKKGD